jgi:hypothetical protein
MAEILSALEICSPRQPTEPRLYRRFSSDPRLPSGLLLSDHFTRGDYPVLIGRLARQVNNHLAFRMISVKRQGFLLAS